MKRNIIILIIILIVFFILGAIASITNTNKLQNIDEFWDMFKKDLIEENITGIIEKTNFPFIVYNEAYNEKIEIYNKNEFMKKIPSGYNKPVIKSILINDIIEYAKENDHLHKEESHLINYYKNNFLNDIKFSYLYSLNQSYFNLLFAMVNNQFKFIAIIWTPIEE